MKVLLIGDSISGGYRPFVKKALKGRAVVRWPKDGGGSSDNVLAHIAEWVGETPWDVIHLNCGLHDLRTSLATGKKQVRLAEYGPNLGKVFAWLKKATKARVVWATTTPVNQKDHNSSGLYDFERFEKDVVAYNKVALRVCKKAGIEVDDLYTTVMNAGKRKYLTPDGAHYTPAGYALLGRQVRKTIR